MPIPVAPGGEKTPAAVVIALLHQVHDELRGLIRACDHEALNFVPCAGANSISTIVTHLVGSETETLETLVGTQSVRNRDEEFERGEQSADALVSQLDAADALLHRVGPALTTDRLVRPVALPTLPSSETRPGMTWLIGSLGHAREHVGHAFLTRQIYEARPEEPA